MQRRPPGTAQLAPSSAVGWEGSVFTVLSTQAFSEKQQTQRNSVTRRPLLKPESISKRRGHQQCNRVALPPPAAVPRTLFSYLCLFGNLLQ